MLELTGAAPSIRGEALRPGNPPESSQRRRRLVAAAGAVTWFGGMNLLLGVHDLDLALLQEFYDTVEPLGNRHQSHHYGVASHLSWEIFEGYTGFLESAYAIHFSPLRHVVVILVRF